MKFAPKAYRNTRLKVTRQVENALILTDDLRGLSPAPLQNQPQILPTLRICTYRLIDLARVNGSSFAGASSTTYLSTTPDAGRSSEGRPLGFMIEAWRLVSWL
jgi:hypothetical protein